MPIFLQYSLISWLKYGDSLLEEKNLDFHVLQSFNQDVVRIC